MSFHRIAWTMCSIHGTIERIGTMFASTWMKNEINLCRIHSFNWNIYRVKTQTAEYVSMEPVIIFNPYNWNGIFACRIIGTTILTVDQLVNDTKSFRILHLPSMLYGAKTDRSEWSCKSTMSTNCCFVRWKFGRFVKINCWI